MEPTEEDKTSGLAQLIRDVRRDWREEYIKCVSRGVGTIVIIAVLGITLSRQK